MTSTTPFGAGDRGTPGRAPGDAVPAAEPRPVAAASTTTSAAVYRDHLELGTPRDADARDDHLLVRPQYALSYNPAKGVANWVSWNVNRTHFGRAPRSCCFRADTALPARFRRVVSSDYAGSGYTRGHLVRSQERTATAADNEAAFLMTNIIPQTADLNAGPWLQLEEHVERLARTEDVDLYVLAGGVYARGHGTLRGEGRVAIPSQSWKIVVAVPFGRGLAAIASARSIRVTAAMMPNTTGIVSAPWQRYCTTVDAIEAATGYDFLQTLPDDVERVVEATGCR